MKWILRIGLGTLAALLLLAGVVIGLAATADFSGYRTEIAAAVEAATGRKVTIGGRIDQRVLTLSPSVVVHEVGFANAPWGRRPEMVKAERVEISLALLPLLSGEFHIKRFTLIGADVLLETNAEGQGNWEFWPKAKREETLAKGERDTSAASTALQNLRIERSLFVFYDGRSKLESRVRIDEIVASAQSISTPLQVQTRGAYNEVPIETKGRLGAFASFLRGSDAFPVELNVTFGKSDLALKVKADLSGRLPRLAGAARSKLLDIDEMAAAAAGKRNEEAAAKPAPPRGAWPEDELPLGILGMFEADLDVRIGRLVAGETPFRDVSAKIALTDGDLRATDFAADLTNGKVAGTLQIDIRSTQPKVAADLHATRISLAQLTREAVGRPLISAPATARYELRAQGRSIRDLVGTLSGPLTVYVGGGPIHQDLFKFASTDLLAVAGLSGRSAFAVTCGVFALQFRNGVGYGRNLVLDTTRLTIYGRGAINLPRRYVDFILVPAGKGVSLTRIAGLVPFRVRGPLDRPSVAPDPSGVPNEVMKGILGAVELPLDIAGSLFGSGNEKRGGCGARRDTGGSLLEKPGELLRKPADTLRRLNPFR